MDIRTGKGVNVCQECGGDEATGHAIACSYGQEVATRVAGALSGDPMRFDVFWCPECGADPYGTVERMEGVARLAPEGEGVTHTGWTEVWWETQETQRDDEGRLRVCCANGHDWYVHILTEE